MVIVSSLSDARHEILRRRMCCKESFPAVVSAEGCSPEVVGGDVSEITVRSEAHLEQVFDLFRKRSPTNRVAIRFAS